MSDKPKRAKARGPSLHRVRYQRGKDRPFLTTEQQRAARRVSELSRIYYQQFPNGLPHNGLGVKYAKYMLRTMAFLPDDRREQWLERHAKWMDGATRAYLLSLGPHWYSRWSLGEHLELYDEGREHCRAWSIEALDVNEEQRRMINKDKDRKRQEKRRRKSGAKPRDQYEAESLSRTKPWEAEGISRPTWFRRRKGGETGPSEPFLIFSTKDELVSPSKPRPSVLKPATPSQPHRRKGRPADVTHWPSGGPMGIHRQNGFALESTASHQAEPSGPQAPRDNVVRFPIERRLAA